MAIELDLTHNYNLKLEIDRDADNWMSIEGFDADVFAPEWKYIVSNSKGSEVLLELSVGNGIEVDLNARKVTLTIAANALEVGTYYHRLYSDTEDANKKFRFGGNKSLIITKY